MSENESNPIIEDSVVESSNTNSETKKPKSKSKTGLYIGSFLIVILIIGGVLFLLEKENRSPTNIFGALVENTTVAIVNGEKITTADLKIGIDQFTQMATMQGVDVTAPETTELIKTQALDVLVNTVLLKQLASERGINITDEEVTKRLDDIKTEMGGEELMQERMMALGIDDKKLRKDVGDELKIQRLFEEIFTEKEVTVTEEEVIEMYEGAGGVEAGLPDIEEVRVQIEQEIQNVKEQKIIEELLTEEKAKAEIEIKNT